jgi:phosphatidate cytidylyltransferase
MARPLTALALIPLILYVVLWGPPWLVSGAVALVALLCYREYLGIAGSYGFGSFGWWSGGAGLALLFVPQTRLWLMVVILAGVVLVAEMTAADFRVQAPRAALQLLGVLYVFGSWRCAIALHQAGPKWLMFSLAVNWIGDASAYYIGRRFGKRKLAPAISPNKSWEGAWAAVAAAMIFGAIYLEATPAMIALAAFVNAIGQIGDLAESALKRGAGVKDSGALLPGHGGMLDRVDSTMFAMPATLAWLELYKLFT